MQGKKWLRKENFLELHKKVGFVERHKCSVIIYETYLIGIF